MSSIKWFRILSSLVVVVMLSVILPFSVMADTTTPSVSMNISSNYPKIEVVSGGTATFTLTLNYTNTNTGAAPKVFDLIVTAPSKWTTTITNSTSTKIAADVLTPGTPDVLTLNVFSPSSPLPEPGDYPITVQANSGDMKANITLTVTVTARYGLEFNPVGSNPVYNVKVTAGKTKSFKTALVNTGTSAITNIMFSTDKPIDWQIDFPQNSVSSIPAGGTQTMDIKFLLPSNAISGDYMITLTAKGDQATSVPLELRVIVETSTIWGWVGVVIIVIVVLGLAFLFARFSRR